jgi:hypothetical protein
MPTDFATQKMPTNDAALQKPLNNERCITCSIDRAHSAGIVSEWIDQSVRPGHPGLVERDAGGDVRKVFDFREVDSRARRFATQYHSAGIHDGAATLPPFVAEALG